jgi:Nuclease-related domain
MSTMSRKWNWAKPPTAPADSPAPGPPSGTRETDATTEKKDPAEKRDSAPTAPGADLGAARPVIATTHVLTDTTADGGPPATSSSRPRPDPDIDSRAAVRHAGTGLTSSRTASRKWVNRAEGDRRAKGRLQLIDDEGVILLNDRRIPGSKSSIKSIAISTAGVFVIDTKAYKGLVHIRREGTIKDLGPAELHIGRRNCTSSVEDLNRQAEIVRGALRSTPWGAEVPVTALLCLTRAAWGFASPIEINDVWVGWPRLLNGRVHEPGLMDSPTVVEVSELIAEQLP